MNSDTEQLLTYWKYLRTETQENSLFTNSCMNFIEREQTDQLTK